MARKSKRPVESYLDSAKNRAKFIPSLAKYKRRKTLTPAEKAAIKRAENMLPYTDYLIPVKGKKAEKLRRAGVLHTPETTIKTGPNAGKIVRHKPIAAVQLRNTGKDAAIDMVTDEAMLAKSHGRPWVYQFVEPLTKAGIAEAAEDAFFDPASYEIEKVIEMAQRAFANPVTKAVYLWAESGRVGDAFETLSEFVAWLEASWRRYKNVDRWMRGIAILVGDAGETISDAEWASFGTKANRARIRAERKARRKRFRKSWK